MERKSQTERGLIKYRGKQMDWLIRKCNVEMYGEYRWGVRKILVGVLLDSALPIYLSVVDMFYLFTSETLRKYNSLL